MKGQPVQAAVRTLLIVLLATLFVGCATRKMDWAGRVGSYTFDQAVLEFGPPDKQARLTDGTTVAEWLIVRGGERRVLLSVGAPVGWGGPVLGSQYMLMEDPDSFLRLTFDANGQLARWKKFSRDFRR